MAIEHTNRPEVINHIVKIVARKAGRPPKGVHEDTRLLHDLGLYGDDAEEVLAEVGDQFHIDYTGLEFQHYFFPEGYALWIMPRCVYRRLLAKKRPLTVGALVTAAGLGRWEAT